MPKQPKPIEWGIGGGGYIRDEAIIVAICAVIVGLVVALFTCRGG